MDSLSRTILSVLLLFSILFSDPPRAIAYNGSSALFLAEKLLKYLKISELEWFFLLKNVSTKKYLIYVRRLEVVDFKETYS